MTLRVVQTDKAPQPAGHYSQATVYNGLVFVAGQLPVDPAKKEQSVGSIEDQARQALKNVKAIVEAAGSSMDKILKVTVFIADISLWGSVNEVYAAFFGEHKPARAIVPTKVLHYGFQLEIEAVAAL